MEAVRYNEMFVRLGYRGSTMRCSGVPATGHLNIRHGTPEHLIVRTVPMEYNEMFRCPCHGTPEHPRHGTPEHP